MSVVQGKRRIFLLIAVVAVMAGLVFGFFSLYKAMTKPKYKLADSQDNTEYNEQRTAKTLGVADSFKEPDFSYSSSSSVEIFAALRNLVAGNYHTEALKVLNSIPDSEPLIIQIQRYDLYLQIHRSQKDQQNYTEKRSVYRQVLENYKDDAAAAIRLKDFSILYPEKAEPIIPTKNTTEAD